MQYIIYLIIYIKVFKYLNNAIYFNFIKTLYGVKIRFRTNFIIYYQLYVD